MESQTENQISAYFIELELVLDIYSLIFCSIRFHLETKFKQEICNKEIASLYGKSIKEGIKEILAKTLSKLELDEEVSIETEVEEVFDNFLAHTKSLKPTVPSIHILKELKRVSGEKIVLFSYLKEEILSKIVDSKYNELVSEIKNFEEVFWNTEDSLMNDKTMVIYGSQNHSDVFQLIEAEKKINLVHVSQPKQEKIEGVESFSNIEWIPFEKYGLPKLAPWYEGSLQRVELNRKIDTPELPFWKEAIQIDPISLQGIVVNGFKRGSKELGVPTANLDLTSENTSKISHLLPGVYSGTVEFHTYESNHDELLEKYGESFSSAKLRTAISIGWNPSYDNNQRTIEAYILEEFDNDFYGETLKINLTHYIRAESNYSSLDHLIMAIHNDIETTKHIVAID